MNELDQAGQQATQTTQTPQAQAPQAAETKQAATTQQKSAAGGDQGKIIPKSAGSLFLEGIEVGDESAGQPNSGPKEREQGKQDGEQDEKQGETKAGTEAKPLARADITLPEDTTYDEDLGNTFLGILNDASISRKDLTQKLADLYVDQQKKMLEAIGAANDAQLKADLTKWNEEIKGWQSATKADPEYGGQKWEASKVIITRGCDRLATPAAAELISEYRLNVHPEIVRMFYRAGKLVGEDSTRGASGSAAPAPGDGLLEMYRKSLKL